MYLKKQSETKSFSLIRNIITVRGKDGTPAVYAVNFNDGYILVSATKEYYPILAEVPHGTFSENDSSTGEDVLMIGYLNTISNVKSENIDKKLLRTLWSPFESNSGHSEAVSYLANSDEIYKNVLDKWLMLSVRCFVLSFSIIQVDSHRKILYKIYAIKFQNSF